MYDVKNYIVELEGFVLNGGVSYFYVIEGIGFEKWLLFLEKELVDGIFIVVDKDVFNNVKFVVNKEGLLVGSFLGVVL